MSGKFYKDIVLKEIESIADRIIEVSDTIHSYAELGTKEFKSSKLLADELEENGFEVERGVAGIPTAFKARFQGEPGPAIAFLAEYDALPELGHACGHNIMGTSSAFAGIALSKIMKKLNGTIMVFGTPDEEGKGAKIPMLKEGVFQGVDAVITNHAFDSTCAWWPSVALGGFTIEFLGKPAHYATPHEGINALDAAIATLSTVNTLRHGFRPDVILGYTIPEGGVISTIVPERATIRVVAKSLDVVHLENVLKTIKGCAEGIGLALGLKVNIEYSREIDSLYYEESIPNLTLINALNGNFQILGVEAEDPMEIGRYRRFYSTDYGNVSKHFPGLNFAIAIGPRGMILHTPEFAEAAISDKGHEALLIATKVMSMTAIDLLLDTEILQKAKTEFLGYKSSDFSNLPLVPVF